MMDLPVWCRECPFYYKGMTVEDYLYLQYCIRRDRLGETVLKIQRGDIKLAPIEFRTKEEVFKKFSVDIKYVFDKELMC